jgi:hypothetical protein
MQLPVLMTNCRPTHPCLGSQKITLSTIKLKTWFEVGFCPGLGWFIDMQMGTMRPSDRGVQKMIWWCYRKAGIKVKSLLLHDLQSLVGLLRWYLSVIPMAHGSLCGLTAQLGTALRATRQPTHWVPNTRAAYNSGYQSLAKFGESMGWKHPYLGGDLREDLVRVLGWIDHMMAIDKGHPASTVDSYVTGAKQQLLVQFVISEALGRAREPRHMLVANAVRSVAVSAAKRATYQAEWICEGRSSWP